VKLAALPEEMDAMVYGETVKRRPRPGLIASLSPLRISATFIHSRESNDSAGVFPCGLGKRRRGKETRRGAEFEVASFVAANWLTSKIPKKVHTIVDKS
jgi:hypothetical protein